MTVARAFVPFGICDRGDLYQTARIELWRSWLNFDSSRGIEFRTYANARIKGSLLHALRDTSGVPGYQWERGERFQSLELDLDRHDPPMREAGFDDVELLDALGRLKPDHRRRALAALHGYETDNAAGAAMGVCCGTAGRWRRAAARALSFLLD